MSKAATRIQCDEPETEVGNDGPEQDPDNICHITFMRLRSVVIYDSLCSYLKQSRSLGSPLLH